MILLGVLWTLAGCDTEVRHVVLHRENCAVCHQPLNDEGEPSGLEEIHPWHPLTCTDCHGGESWVCDGPVTQGEEGPACEGDWVYDQARAHVSPGAGPSFLKDLSPAALDKVDRAYLRFVNPGDFRVISKTCGRCHTSESAKVKRSLMAHAAGELGGARFRSGKTTTSLGSVGAVDVTDLNPLSDDGCTQSFVTRFSPPPIDPGSSDPFNAPTPANAQDQFLAKQCVGCHLNSFGNNNGPGLYRSSGCSACHVPYANHGLSASKDPWINPFETPHPIQHRMVTAPTTETCAHCHHEGARIGLSFRGIRERIGALPPHAATLGSPMYGKDSDGYLVDEDIRNAIDETPPDVHFEAGMHCVDCHTRAELHGDGHLQANAMCTESVTCEDCHGTPRKRATPTPAFERLRTEDGVLKLRTRVTDRDLEVPQIVDAITPGHPRFSPRAQQAMGVNADGFSHADGVACQTCHSAWIPTCYGCHIEVNLAESQPYTTTGALVPGRASGEGIFEQLNDLVLMKNARGRLMPSMPAERLFLSLFHQPAGEPRQDTFRRAPRHRLDAQGTPLIGHGQRAVDPHTTQKRSQFMACDRCHSVGSQENPSNAALLDITHGFGSQRFIYNACELGKSCADADDWVPYPLDALLDSEGKSLIARDPADGQAARPLTLGEIGRMRAIVLQGDEGWSTPVPPDARTNPAFPGFMAPGDPETEAAPAP